MNRHPIYNRDIDGPDVFAWILEAAHVYRELKKQEREEIIGNRRAAEKATQEAINASAKRDRRSPGNRGRLQGAA